MNTGVSIKADPRSSFRASILVGIGIMAAVDEIVFHQILQWHHFFDLSTSTVGIVSDGLLHAAELIFVVSGFSILLHLRRNGKMETHWAWAGFFVGMGGFQLFDGIVDHKLLRLHQIRYVDNVILYDIAWNLGGLLLVLIGILLVRHARSDARTALERS